MPEATTFNVGVDSHLDRVTVILVTYNSRHCLKDLAQPLSQFAHVCISDNASSDGTVELARQLLPHASVLEQKKNLGFGAANNRAITQAVTPYVLLLNPDCELNPSSVTRLLEVAELFPTAAIIAPQLLRADRSLDISYRWPSDRWKPRVQEAAQGLCCVGFVTGAVMLCRLSEFEKTGFFDEAFFLYYEDDDLCLRLFNAQKSIVVTPDVQWVHASRGSVRGNTPYRAEYWRGYHHAQSKILFARKHVSAQAAMNLRSKTLMLALLTMPFRLMFPKPELVARLFGRIAGLWNTAQNKPLR
jgi:N-acetylglucosaminyl-diphospho-decaprenol L-rhamnosyltransferase